MNDLWKFILVGGTAATANAVARIGLSKVLDFELAVALAYGVGMTCAFILSKIFVFERSGRSTGAEFTRFAIVNAFALLIVMGVTVFLAKVAFPFIGFTWHADTVAHVIGILAPVFTSYLGHKYFTFDPKVKPT